MMRGLYHMKRNSVSVGAGTDGALLGAIIRDEGDSQCEMDDLGEGAAVRNFCRR
jgi:hypothetical protein